MVYYTNILIDDFLYILNGVTTVLWTEKIFKVNNHEKKMDKERKGIFIRML